MTSKTKKISDLAQANYERGVLTLDLPRALQPMLWRQEIKNIANVVFWLARQDNGEHTLMMRLSNGQEQTIARFDNEAIAEQSLAAVRSIFIGKKNKPGFWGGLIKIILIILLVWVLGSLAFQLAAAIAIKQNPNAQAMMDAASGPTPNTPVPPAPAPPLPTATTSSTQPAAPEAAPPLSNAPTGN